MRVSTACKLTAYMPSKIWDQQQLAPFLNARWNLSSPCLHQRKFVECALLQWSYGWRKSLHGRFSEHAHWLLALVCTYSPATQLQDCVPGARMERPVVLTLKMTVQHGDDLPWAHTLACLYATSPLFSHTRFSPRPMKRRIKGPMAFAAAGQFHDETAVSIHWPTCKLACWWFQECS